MSQKPKRSSDCRFCQALNTLTDSRLVAESVEGVLTIGGRQVLDDHLAILAAEAKAFRQMSLHRIFTETARAHAISQGLKNAKDFDQVLFGKALLYYSDIVESSMTAIENEQKRRTILNEAKLKA